MIESAKRAAIGPARFLFFLHSCFFANSAPSLIDNLMSISISSFLNLCFGITVAMPSGIF